LAQKLPLRVLYRINKHKLPTAGGFPFIPKVRNNRRGQADLVTAPATHGRKRGKYGFVDPNGRIWIRDLAHADHPDHWDVQEDGGKRYFRVDDDGELIP